MPERDYGYTGSWQHFDVPAKVEWVDVTLDGAGSGSVPGGQTSGRVSVKGSNVLYFLVGEKGTEGGGTTTGGGGAAGRGQSGHGWSGGGGTTLRMNSRTGSIIAVAGGAGGTSGDGGRGGSGGGDVAEAGRSAPNYPNGIKVEAGLWTYDIVGTATGGTQIQGGNGGNSALDPTLDGGDASDRLMSDGAAGGRAGSRGFGGGGGGGGYHGGGGGQGGLPDLTPGGGGGGGANYVGSLVSYRNTQAGGGTGNGHVTLTWVSPAPANQPPSPPTEVKVGGDDYTAEMPTMSRGKVTITAKVGDPNSKKVKMVAYYAPNETFAQRRVLNSELVERGKRARITLAGLAEDTLWHVRLYSRDASGLLSTNYTALRFWTNRRPAAPNLISPGDNSQVSSLTSPVFSWTHVDPDQPQVPQQRGFRIQWRRAGTAVHRPGDWLDLEFRTRDSTYVGEAAAFKANTTYEWRVRTQDSQTRWGQWSLIRSFYVSGTTAPPWPLSPARSEAIDIADPIVFEWQFRDPNQGAVQRNADVRYRPLGSPEWHTIVGTPDEPGSAQRLELPIDEMPAGHYEWQVRTVSDKLDIPSDWSDPERFFVVATPGITNESVTPVLVVVEARLGCGHNEVHIYRRGGRQYVGRLSPVTEVMWSRRRDDISNSTILIDDTASNGPLLLDTHCWTHEAVIFRGGERVWEGPIARMTDGPGGQFHIEAKDVLNYPYRRIMRQGFNDAYRIVNNVQVGQRTVVQRARQILMNALAPDDPNVLAYLTSFDFPNDAVQSRSVPDFAKMSWEEVDDMAATAGLDYTAVGRRIMLWDTHRPIGRLPEMRSEHFSDPPIVSEYGMLLATDFGVTNNNGLYGLATVRGEGETSAYGVVEQLASAFGETEGGATETLTSEGQANLERTLTTQAGRNIANRYPTPVIVRVPDNSALSAETPVKINWLIPGVWIPLRAQGSLRPVSQWQKLDQVTVREDSKGEKVTVVMSPAPNAGADPDAEGGQGDEG